MSDSLIPHDESLKNKKQEIVRLNKELLLKKRVFELLQVNNIDTAAQLLQQNSSTRSYFMKFKSQSGTQLVILPVMSENQWIVNYHPNNENIISEDLERLSKELEEKENRLEQYVFLKQQQKMADLQVAELDSAKKDRERMQEFTFVLAFGVIVSALFNLFQIYVEFNNATKLRVVIFSGIFILLFVGIIIFVLNNFNMKTQINITWKKSWISMIIIAVFIIILLYLNLIVSLSPPINNLAINVPNISENATKNVSDFNTSQIYMPLKTPDIAINSHNRINQSMT